MDYNGLDGPGFLDKVRTLGGSDKCREAFALIFEGDSQKALDLINNDEMTFPCLFILLDLIDSLNLERQLNPLNFTAARISRQITAPGKSDGNNDYFGGKNDTVHSALKWMIQTGGGENGLGVGYDKIMDIAVSVLINKYEDKSIMPVACDMIFKRAKQGGFTHDLVWAFFKSHDTAALRLAASHLLSGDADEAGFAFSLLNIKSVMGKTENDPQKQYDAYLGWLEENGPSLRFTDESFQFASRPVMYTADAGTTGLQAVSGQIADERGDFV